MYNRYVQNRSAVFIHCLCLLGFALPFEIRTITILCILLSGIACFSVSNKEDLKARWKSNRIYIFSFSSIFFINVVGIIHSENIDVALSRLETRVVYLLFPILIFLSQITQENLRKIIASFSVGTILSSLYCLAYTTYDYFTRHDLPANIKFSYIELLKPLDLHPNFHAIYLSFTGLFLLHEMLFHKHTRAYQVGIGIFLFVSLILNYMVQSRGPLLAGVALMMMMLIYYTYKRISVKSILLFLTFIFAIGIGFLNTQKSNSIDRFTISTDELTKHFFDADTTFTIDKEAMSTLFHVRSWYCAVGLLSDYHFFTGYGSGDEKDVLVSCYEDHEWSHMVESRYSAHNEYLSAFLRNGITEFFLIVALLLFPLYHALRQKQILWVCFILLWGAVFLISSLNRASAIYTYALFNSLFFSVYTLKNIKVENNDSYKDQYSSE
jgi:O-antigen ligase